LTELDSQNISDVNCAAIADNIKLLLHLVELYLNLNYNLISGAGAALETQLTKLLIKLADNNISDKYM
jgi:hypothetical protein